MSSPAWTRGLKPEFPDTCSFFLMSRPAWTRGLKQTISGDKTDRKPILKEDSKDTTGPLEGLPQLVNHGNLFIPRHTLQSTKPS